MKNRYEFIAVVLIGNGEPTDEFTVYIAQMADRLTTQLEIAKKALQTIAESSPQDNEAAKIIAAEALKSIVE